MKRQIKLPNKPGKVLAADIEHSGLKMSRLSELTGIPKSNLSVFLRGNMPCSALMAIRLEKALGIPAKYWLTLQLDYDLALARIEYQKQQTK